MLSYFKGFFSIRRCALVVGIELFWQVCFREQYGTEKPPIHTGHVGAVSWKCLTLRYLTQFLMFPVSGILSRQF